MPLPAGTCIGPYEVSGAIGAGGMGEVYRARDTNLGRDVALKILPPAFALVPDRDARFRAAHNLKASSGNLGAAQLSAWCRQLETLAETHTDGALDLVAAIETEYDRVRTELEQHAA